MALVCLAVLLPAAAEETKEVRKTVPLAAGGRLTLENHAGYIRITAWDQPQVEIYARIKEPDWGLFRDTTKVRDTEIRIDSPSATSVWVKTDYTKLNSWFFGGDNPPVDYTIRMPRSASLTLKDHRSEIDIDGVKSDIEIQTHAGRVTARNVEGSLHFSSHRGTGEFRFAGLTKPSRFETHSGTIRLYLPRDKGFVIDADLDRGATLRSDFDLPSNKTAAGRHMRMRRQERYGSVNGGGPTLRFRAHRGTYEIRRG